MEGNTSPFGYENLPQTLRTLLFNRKRPPLHPLHGVGNATAEGEAHSGISSSFSPPRRVQDPSPLVRSSPFPSSDTVPASNDFSSEFPVERGHCIEVEARVVPGPSPKKGETTKGMARAKEVVVGGLVNEAGADVASTGSRNTTKGNEKRPKARKKLSMTSSRTKKKKHYNNNVKKSSEHVEKDSHPVFNASPPVATKPLPLPPSPALPTPLLYTNDDTAGAVHEGKAKKKREKAAKMRNGNEKDDHAGDKEKVEEEGEEGKVDLNATKITGESLLPPTLLPLSSVSTALLSIQHSTPLITLYKEKEEMRATKGTNHKDEEEANNKENPKDDEEENNSFPHRKNITETSSFSPECFSSRNEAPLPTTTATTTMTMMMNSTKHVNSSTSPLADLNPSPSLLMEVSPMTFSSASTPKSLVEDMLKRWVEDEEEEKGGNGEITSRIVTVIDEIDEDIHERAEYEPDNGAMTTRGKNEVDRKIEEIGPCHRSSPSTPTVPLVKDPPSSLPPLPRPPLVYPFEGTITSPADLPHYQRHREHDDEEGEEVAQLPSSSCSSTPEPLALASRLPRHSYCAVEHEEKNDEGKSQQEQTEEEEEELLSTMESMLGETLEVCYLSEFTCGLSNPAGTPSEALTPTTLVSPPPASSFPLSTLGGTWPASLPAAATTTTTPTLLTTPPILSLPLLSPLVENDSPSSSSYSSSLSSSSLLSSDASILSPELKTRKQKEEREEKEYLKKELPIQEKDFHSFPHDECVGEGRQRGENAMNRTPAAVEKKERGKGASDEEEDCPTGYGTRLLSTALPPLPLFSFSSLPVNADLPETVDDGCVKFTSLDGVAEWEEEEEKREELGAEKKQNEKEEEETRPPQLSGADFPPSPLSSLLPPSFLSSPPPLRVVHDVEVLSTSLAATAGSPTAPPSRALSHDLLPELSHSTPPFRPSFSSTSSFLPLEGDAFDPLRTPEEQKKQKKKKKIITAVEQLPREGTSTAQKKVEEERSTRKRGRQKRILMEEEEEGRDGWWGPDSPRYETRQRVGLPEVAPSRLTLPPPLLPPLPSPLLSGGFEKEEEGEDKRRRGHPHCHMDPLRLGDDFLSSCCPVREGVEHEPTRKEDEENCSNNRMRAPSPLKKKSRRGEGPSFMDHLVHVGKEEEEEEEIERVQHRMQEKDQEEEEGWECHRDASFSAAMMRHSMVSPQHTPPLMITTTTETNQHAAAASSTTISLEKKDEMCIRDHMENSRSEKEAEEEKIERALSTEVRTTAILPCPFLPSPRPHASCHFPSSSCSSSPGSYPRVCPGENYYVSVPLSFPSSTDMEEGKMEQSLSWRSRNRRQTIPPTFPTTIRIGKVLSVEVPKKGSIRSGKRQGKEKEEQSVMLAMEEDEKTKKMADGHSSPSRIGHRSRSSSLPPSREKKAEELEDDDDCVPSLPLVTLALYSLRESTLQQLPPSLCSSAFSENFPTSPTSSRFCRIYSQSVVELSHMEVVCVPISSLQFDIPVMVVPPSALPHIYVLKEG